MADDFPRRGHIVLVNLDPTVGTETRKTRPCVVVSNDRANEFSPQLTVVPVTAYHPRKASIPICVEVAAGEGGLSKRSVVNCSQIRTIDKARVGNRVLGTLGSDTLDEISRALQIHLALR